MEKDKFKHGVTAIAIKRHWTPEQVEFAEDYIDELYASRSTARRPKRPLELPAVLADLIRRSFWFKNRVSPEED